MNINAGQLSENDLVIALSVSGETSLVIAAANMAKSRGAALVSVTNREYIFFRYLERT